MGKKKICLDRNWREAFRGTALWRVHSTHSVIPLFSYSIGEALLEKKVPSDIREHIHAYCEKGNSLRQILERSFLWNFSVIYVFISHRKSILCITLLEKWINWIPSDKKQKGAFCETALWRVNSNHTVQLLFSLSSIFTLFFFSLWRDIQEYFKAYGENGNIFRYKLERSFTRSCFMMCVLHSQSYTFLLIEDWGIPFGEKATRGHSRVYGRL